MTTRVGFIGLGQQGRPMAINLSEDGFDLMVHDIRAGPVAELVTIGAKGARSPAEVDAQAGIVAVIQLDDAQVEEVVLGRDGVLGAIEPGGVIVIHSTIRPRTVRKIVPCRSEKRRRDLIPRLMG